MTSSLVLVHGAWGRPDDWDDVVAALPESTTVLRADLPSCRHADASLHDDIDEVKALVASADGGVVLVGHSYGGCVITGAGVHANVRHLVYVASYMPDERESLVSARDPDASTVVTPPLPPPAGDVSTLDDWDVDDGSYSVEAMARKRARPRRPWSARAMYDTVDEVAWRPKPSTFVVAARDDAIPPEIQRRHAQRADQVVELDTPHFPSFEAPKALAEILVEVLDSV
jgi:pimeloyl-ACP methyl ester carboxylesterase